MAGPRASQAPEAGFCACFDRRMRMQQQYLPLLIRTCGLENLALNTAAMGTEVVQLLLSCLSPVGAPCSLGSRHPGCHGVCGGGGGAVLVLDILLSTFPLAQDVSSHLCLCLPCLPPRCPQTLCSPLLQVLDPILSPPKGLHWQPCLRLQSPPWTLSALSCYFPALTTVPRAADTTWSTPPN